MSKQGKRKTINYGDFYNLEVIGSIIPVIMDYDRALIQEEYIDLTLVYNDIRKVFSLLDTELKIKPRIIIFLIFDYEYKILCIEPYY